MNKELTVLKNAVNVCRIKHRPPRRLQLRRHCAPLELAGNQVFAARVTVAQMVRRLLRLPGVVYSGMATTVEEAAAGACREKNAGRQTERNGNAMAGRAIMGME